MGGIACGYPRYYCTGGHLVDGVGALGLWGVVGERAAWLSPSTHEGSMMLIWSLICAARISIPNALFVPMRDLYGRGSCL